MLQRHNIDKLKVDRSYKLENVSVRSYNNSKYFTTKSGFNVTDLDDIGDVQDTSTVEEHSNEIKNAEVITVSRLNRGRVCIACRGKVNPIAINSKIGLCTRCSANQRLDKCSMELSAALLIGTDGNTQTLNAFLPIIKDIIEITDISDMNEEVTDPFTITYSSNTINTVYRPKQLE